MPLVFVANLGANRSSAFGVGLVLKQLLDLPYRDIGLVAFARNAPCHAHTYEARSVVRLIVAIVNDERWMTSPHGLARRTDAALMHVHTAAREDCGVRRILDRNNSGWQRPPRVVVQIAPNQEERAAPKALGRLCALFVEVARGADCR